MTVALVGSDSLLAREIRDMAANDGAPLDLRLIAAEGEQAGDAYLRIVLAEPGRAGLGDLVREKLPNALEVMLDEEHRPRPGSRDGDRPSRVGRSPQELFGDYLHEQNIEDPRLNALFAELLDDVTGAEAKALPSVAREA